MNIMVADGFALNPGDLSWGELARLGDLTVFDRSSERELLARAESAELLLTNKAPVTAKSVERLTALRYIGVLATGYNIVDVAAASERGIVVTNIPAYSTQSVCQLVFALLLELCHHAQRHSDRVHGGAWSRSADFTFRDFPLIELAGKTLGVFGFGQIGRVVASAGAAFGMRVAVCSRTHRELPSVPIEWVEREELFRRSDVLCLSCPLTPETAGMINRESLALMKESAFLINTARGGLVVERELADALSSGRIAGAGLDVLSTEPPAPDNPLIGAPNCIVTPHIAWATLEARARLLRIAADNVRAFLEGRPQNVVSAAGARGA